MAPTSSRGGLILHFFLIFRVQVQRRKGRRHQGREARRRSKGGGGGGRPASRATRVSRSRGPTRSKEREFFIDNLLVRIHFIILMIRWNGLAPWSFELPFPGNLTSTFLDPIRP